MSMMDDDAELSVKLSGLDNLYVVVNIYKEYQNFIDRVFHMRDGKIDPSMWSNVKTHEYIKMLSVVFDVSHIDKEVELPDILNKDIHFTYQRKDKILCDLFNKITGDLLERHVVYNKFADAYRDSDRPWITYINYYTGLINVAYDLVKIEDKEIEDYI